MDFSNKSVVVTKFGDYDCLEVKKFPLPPLEDKIEVKVKYCGVNFADTYTRQGLFPHAIPFVLGIECSGIISAIGKNTSTDFLVGQRVICYDYKGGLHSDVIRIEPNKCFLLPDDMSFEIGAAVFVNYLTAYFTLFFIGNLKENESVFIKAIAGGVGTALTQLGKLKRGVKIYGTASQGKEEYAIENGANAVFSYDNLESQIESTCPGGFDLIIENESGESCNKIQNYLKQLGRLVILGANNLVTNSKKISLFSLFKLWWNTKNISIFELINNNRAIGGLHLGVLVEKERSKVCGVLEVIFDLIRKGEIEPKVHSVWAIDKVVDAFKFFGDRKSKGKILLKVDDD